MRLVDTTTCRLADFQSDIPDYAILSHVWEEEEVTFRDIADLDKAEKMQGFAKIVGACNTARKDSLAYIWIDTCCINKESSAELSESINSMYAWYKNARVCYAYLADVPSEGHHTDPFSLFAMSRWFTRGWTLQELIAPQKVVFYGEDWIDIGTKATLQEEISAITGIAAEAIAGELVLDSVPVAVRMSWAADRITTREEDIGYSLMGLFDVNMPLLYGEGRKAFIRLQHEIIKKSSDHSIFAWVGKEDEHRGMLARSPSEFRFSGKVERILSSDQLPYSMTNKGLHLELPVMLIGYHDPLMTMALLNCRFSGKEGSDPIIITLLQPSAPAPSSEYIRGHGIHSLSNLSPRWDMVEKPVQKSSLYIADDYSVDVDSRDPEKRPTVLLKLKVPAEYGKLHCSGSSPVRCWEEIAENEWKCTRQPKCEEGNPEKDLIQSYPSYEDSGYEDYEYEEISGDEWAHAEQIVQGSGQGAVLVFENPQRRNRFAVIVGLKDLEAVVWCDVLADLQDEKARDIFESYCDPPGAACKTRKTRFLDRSSADLAYGWSVTASSGASKVISASGEEYPFSVEVEVKGSPRGMHVVQPLELPYAAAYGIVPPAPKHGFTVDIDNLKQIASNPHWVEHLGSFFFNSHSLSVNVVPFKNSWSGEGFCLLVGFMSGAERKMGWYVWIEKTIPEDPKGVLYAKGKLTEEKTYSAVLDQGKAVFVTQRISRDKSVALSIFKLSM